jgi:hypothetical protein
MQPDLILTPFGKNAAVGTIDPIPQTRGPGDDPQQATWDEGFPQVTMTPLGAGGIPPKGQDFNGVLKAISEHTVFSEHGGQFKWSSVYVAASGGYSIGDVIQADDGLNSYVSLVNTNTANFNTTPGSIGVSWGLYAGRNTQVQATETVSGIAEIATQAEVTTGADDARIVTPAKLRGAQATQAEAEAGTDNTKLMTPLRARQQRDKAGFAIDTGTANTYVCAFTPAITSRIEGQVLKFKVKTANTGASTLNDGVGVVALVGGAQTALQGGELVANGDAWVQWNTSVGGGSYILLFCTGAAEQVAPATQSQHAMQLGQATGRLLGPPQIFTATGTYTPTPGTNSVVVEVQAAGGGGAGSPITNSGQASLGSPGGAGAYAKSRFTSGFAGVVVTVGTGGTGGPGTSGGFGGVGGLSSFGSLISCPGGLGGSTAGPGSPPFSAVTLNTAAPTGGNIIASVGAGAPDVQAINITNIIGGAVAGSSLFGPGANYTSSAPGLASPSKGAGGGATGNPASRAAVVGGAGGNGIVIIWEYS